MCFPGPGEYDLIRRPNDRCATPCLLTRRGLRGGVRSGCVRAGSSIPPHQCAVAVAQSNVGDQIVVTCGLKNGAKNQTWVTDDRPAATVGIHVDRDYPERLAVSNVLFRARSFRYIELSNEERCADRFPRHRSATIHDQGLVISRGLASRVTLCGPRSFQRLFCNFLEVTN